ncbi:hypothetical protein [Kribbella speibonae]|nr:hypothetical protein [Kribbella speibonae]
MISDTVASSYGNNLAPVIRNVLEKVMQDQLDALLINTTEEPS